MDAPDIIELLPDREKELEVSDLCQKLKHLDSMTI